MGSRSTESGGSLPRMRIPLPIAGLLAALAAAACASNEPNPPTPPGNAPPADTGAPQAKTCEQGGKTYAIGESFPSEDGCNTCSCTEAGAACTRKACAAAACSPDKEPNREYKIRNPEECKAALFRCDAGKKTFFNECGCGCE